MYPFFSLPRCIIWNNRIFFFWSFRCIYASVYLYIYIFPHSVGYFWMLLLSTMSYCLWTGRYIYIAFPCSSSSTAAVKKNVAWNKSELLILWLLGRFNQFSKKVLIHFIQESNSLDRGLSEEKSDLLLRLSVSLYGAAWVLDTEKSQSKPKKNNWKQCQKKVFIKLPNYIFEENKG